MKLRYSLFFFVSFVVAFAAVPTAQKALATKSTAKKATGAKTVTRNTVQKKVARKTTAVNRTAGTKRRRIAAGPAIPANSWRSRQQAPTPERYKEIQQALAAKGYLKTEPNGVWDADSAEALRQFQTDQKISPTGKINAPSLIGLGLGGSAPTVEPSAPGAREAPPATESGPALRF
jgi:hypothetical protein